MDTPGVTLLTMGSVLAGYVPTLLSQQNYWVALAAVVVAVVCFFARDYVKQ